MSATESYGAFAYAYDQALGERYFRSVRRLLAEVLDRYPHHGPDAPATHLDIACGTGLAIPFFSERGFVSTGLDLSPVMLNVARKRTQQLVAGDARLMPLRGTFSRITCLYDSLNHLLMPRDLEMSFREIRALMGPDSLFLFDMNHPEIYPEVWGMKEPFVDEGRDCGRARRSGTRADRDPRLRSLVGGQDGEAVLRMPGSMKRGRETSQRRDLATPQRHPTCRGRRS